MNDDYQTLKGCLFPILYAGVWSLTAAAAGGCAIGIPTYGIYLLFYCLFCWPVNLLALIWLLVFSELTCWWLWDVRGRRWVLPAVMLGITQALILATVAFCRHAPDIGIIGGNDLIYDMGAMGDADLTSPAPQTILWQYGLPCLGASVAASYILSRALARFNSQHV